MPEHFDNAVKGLSFAEKLKRLREQRAADAPAAAARRAKSRAAFESSGAARVPAPKSELVPAPEQSSSTTPGALTGDAKKRLKKELGIR